MSEVLKPPRSLDAQVDLLLDRGLTIASRAAAERALLDGNYYRLSGYLRQFQVNPSAGDNAFLPGTTLDDVLAARDCDDECSRLLLAGLLRVERVLRSRFAYFAAMRFGGGAFYLERSNYLEVMPKCEAHIAKVSEELMRARSATVYRYAVNGDLAGVPVWVAIEQLSFGTVSTMMEYVVDKRAAKDVADSLGLPWNGFTSTIHGLAVLRNACAHHGQLWHRRPRVGAPFPAKQRASWPEGIDHQGLIPVVAAAIRFLRAIDPACAAAAAIESFVQSVPSPRSAGYLNPAPK